MYLKWCSHYLKICRTNCVCCGFIEIFQIFKRFLENKCVIYKTVYTIFYSVSLRCEVWLFLCMLLFIAVLNPEFDFCALLFSFQMSVSVTGSKTEAQLETSNMLPCTVWTMEIVLQLCLTYSVPCEVFGNIGVFVNFLYAELWSLHTARLWQAVIKVKPMCCHILGIVIALLSHFYFSWLHVPSLTFKNPCAGLAHPNRLFNKSLLWHPYVRYGKWFFTPRQTWSLSYKVFIYNRKVTSGIKKQHVWLFSVTFHEIQHLSNTL